MKKILAIAFAAMMSLGTMAQTAQQVLDKTAAVIGNKKGATANFKLSSPARQAVPSPSRVTSLMRAHRKPSYGITARPSGLI